MENYPFQWKLEADRLEIKLRLSIFTIISVCAGLPALVWSVSDLIDHRRNGHRISVFIILLLLTDFVELFLSPYILLKHLLDEISSYKNWTCWVFWSLWWSLRVCGLLLNQLVALDGIISGKYPLNTASVFSSNYIISFYIITFLCIIIGQIFLHSTYYVFLALLVLIVSVVTWAISCGASSSAERYSHTSRKPDPHILLIFIYTLLVLYLPFLALRFFLFIARPRKLSPLWFIPYFLMSMRLISDPLLCVLVCRQNFRIQRSQTSEESGLV